MTKLNLVSGNVFTRFRINYNNLFIVVCTEADKTWMLGNSHTIPRTGLTKRFCEGRSPHHGSFLAR